MTVDWWLLVVSWAFAAATSGLAGYSTGYRHSTKDFKRTGAARDREIAAAKGGAQWEVRIKSDGVSYSPGLYATVQAGEELRVILARVVHLTSGESVPIEELLIHKLRGDSTTFTEDLRNILEIGAHKAALLNGHALGL
jgi:hypothetical protein